MDKGKIIKVEVWSKNNQPIIRKQEGDEKV